MFPAEIMPSYDADQFNAALALIWGCVGMCILFLVWPGGQGRRLARQIFALGVLGFREGIRQNVLWMMFSLSAIAGGLAYFSDADGTHSGRARLIIETSLSIGEVLGASLIVLLSAFSVSREIESRIMYTLGTKPVPRVGILAGKALGFWCVQLVYAVVLILFTAALVRAVPLRPETRQTDKFSGNTGDASVSSWEKLHRSTLFTRRYRLPEHGEGATPSLAIIKAGEQRTFEFEIERSALNREALEIQFHLASSMAFNPLIPDMLVRMGYAGSPPILEKTISVAQDRPFSIYLEDTDVAESGRLQVTLGASKEDKYKTSILVSAQHGVRAGLPADGLVGNLSKSFVLLALQGWILALITTAWSGVLSFPVTVALGLLMVLGGEMSRQALLLLDSNSETLKNMGPAAMDATNAASEGVKAMTAYIVLLLKILPDFRTAGGPAAFIDGNFISGWAIAYAAFWMGVVRAFGWAIPGALSFQGREVGK